MFVLERTRATISFPDSASPGDETPRTVHAPIESITIAGTTGNVYIVTISHLPSCTCPHALKGNQCKHIIYVLNRVLKAPLHLQYQLAFITPELYDIFDTAPPIKPDVQITSKGNGEVEAEEAEGRKKIEDGDECPICCVDFSETSDATVWCKAACGNNMHKACFGQWVTQKRASKSEVTCPFW